MSPVNKRNSRPIVTVVLATYNGERFLPDQLESLAAQYRRPDRLVLRDDGSDDRSVELVRNWADRHGVTLQQVAGSRLGPSRSFLQALQLAQPADIFLFCDQDDVWLPHKIERALDFVPWGEGAEPTLCATRLEVVDERLKHLRLTQLPHHLSFASATCESMLTGCTMAFNAAFRQRLVRFLPENAVMHDWWCYLLATGADSATLHFDPTPTVLYRQHGGNALGAGPTGLSAALARLRRFAGRDALMRSRQLRELGHLHGIDLSPQASALLQQLLAAKCGLWPRLRATFTAPIHRQTVIATWTTRFALLVNRF